MTGTFGREVQSMRSAPREPFLVRPEADPDLRTEVGSETRSCTALFRLIEGVQEDGSSRDDACREDDVRLAAPQGEWVERGMQDAHVRGGGGLPTRFRSVQRPPPWQTWSVYRLVDSVSQACFAVR